MRGRELKAVGFLVYCTSSRIKAVEFKTISKIGSIFFPTSAEKSSRITSGRIRSSCSKGIDGKEANPLGDKCLTICIPLTLRSDTIKKKGGEIPMPL